MLVAVGDGVLSSPDGITWTFRGSAGFSGLAITGVAWSPSLEIFVIVGDAGKVATSPDGVTWTNPPLVVRPDGYNAYFNDLIWIEELGMFVGVGGSGTIARSADGISWQVSILSDANNHRIAWSPELARMVILRGDGLISHSADGISWETVVAPTGTGSSTGVAQGVDWSPSLGIFVALWPYENAYSLRSSDGKAWTANGGASMAYFRAVEWSQDLGLFLATGANGEVASSVDGINWSVATHPLGTTQQVLWSPEVQQFIVVGQHIATSPDGVTWTVRKSNAWYRAIGGTYGSSSPYTGGLVAARRAFLG